MTRNQWLLIGVVAVVILLGSFGYYFSTRGSLGMGGLRLETKFGLGPDVTTMGNPSSPSSPSSPFAPHAPNYHSPAYSPYISHEVGKESPLSCDDYCQAYWKGQGTKARKCVQDFCQKGDSCLQVCRLYGQEPYCQLACNLRH